VNAQAEIPPGQNQQPKPCRSTHRKQRQVVAGLLPAGAHYAKALGTLLTTSWQAAANRTPSRAVLFYATDDERAAAAVKRLIRAAGFDPVKVGGVSEAARIEAGGDLSQAGGLNGRLLDADQARAALAPATV